MSNLHTSATMIKFMAQYISHVTVYDVGVATTYTMSGQLMFTIVSLHAYSNQT